MIIKYFLPVMVLFTARLSAQPSGSIVVALDTLHAEQGGNLIVALYADEDAWLDFSKAYRLSKQPVVPGLESVTFDSLPAGRYAVQVLHDKDRDGKMGFTWLPPGPSEAAGVSNNAMRMGKPLFEPALVDVHDTPVPVYIIMRY